MSSKRASCCALLFILLYVNADVCNETYLTFHGLQCFPCQPGHVKIDDCSINQTRAQCAQCNTGTYQPHCISANEIGECRNCAVCAIYIERCTLFKNAVCGESIKTKEADENNETSRRIQTEIVVSMVGMVVLLLFCLLPWLVIYLRRCRKRKDDGIHKHRNIQEDDEIHGDEREKNSYIDVHVGEKMSKNILFGCTKQVDFTSPTKDKCSPLAIVPTIGCSIEDDDEKKCSGECTAKCVNFQMHGKSFNSTAASGEKSASTFDKVPSIECLIGGNDKKKDSGKYSTEIKNLRVHAEAKSNRTNVRSEENRNIAVTQSIPLAVISPVQEVCTEIDNNCFGPYQLRRESIQSAADKENAEVTSKPNFDWTKICLQLANLFPAPQWELFAIHLLCNCQQVQKDFKVQDVIDKIKFEARSEHSIGWVVYAYLKVFNKWLTIMGNASATFEQIEEAVACSIYSKETMDLVLDIKRNPPIIKSLVPVWNAQILKIPNANIQQSFALYDSETTNMPGSAQCSSRQIQSIETTRHSNPALGYPQLMTPQRVCTCEATHASFHYNTMHYEMNSYIGSQALNNQGRDKKRKLSNLQDKNKLTKLETYARDNAKENLLSDQIPIRQRDYEIYMEHVIDLIKEECNVSRKVVLSVTLKAFNETEEIRTKTNENVYLLYGGQPKLCLRKEVYDNLVVYVEIVRPKLLKYLVSIGFQYDEIVTDTFLFLSFDGKAAFDQMLSHRNRKRRADEQVDAKSFPRLKSSSTTSNVKIDKSDAFEGSEIEEEDKFIEVNQNKTCHVTSTLPHNLKHSRNTQYLSRVTPEIVINQMEENEVDVQHEHLKTSTDINSHNDIPNTHIQQGTKTATSEVGCQTENIINSNADVEDMDKMQQNINSNKRHDDLSPTSCKSIESDSEMDMICESFFPTGEETFMIKNVENVAGKLESFIEQYSGTLTYKNDQ